MSPALLGGLVALGLVGAVVAFAFRHEWKRRAEAAAVAAELGFEPDSGAEAPLAEELKGFDLLQKGSGGRVRDLHRTTIDGVRISLFECDAGTGEDSIHLSALCLQSPRMDLPAFTLEPEGWVDRIAAALGFDDIDFEHRPEFSKHYLLRGADEAGIRRLFRDQVLDAFEGRDDICVEAQGGTLLVYSSRGRVPVDRIRSFVERGLELFALFGGK